ncbi:MAG: hypothetical protein IKB82_06135 [Clostridia bacterium]|nr:hypothetical protein [Clostridia bacterium]
MKRFKALVLSVCLMILFASPALCATRGPATSYPQLLEMAAAAQEGDVLLISGDFSAEGHSPLSTQVYLRIASSEGATATLRHMQIENAHIAFSNIELMDSLSVSGVSHIELTDSVRIKGAPGKSAILFDGSGALLVYPGCTVEGGESGDGISIHHRGGDFYAGIEGTVFGGSGITGGSGMTISPLSGFGTLMISGSVSGGHDQAVGGHALNLYDLSNNAFVTVSGTLQGGRGAAGGDGIQIVAARDNASIGIQGTVSGGRGEDFGGDALILMNVAGAATINLSGMLCGGDVTRAGGNPGMSLLVVSDTSAAHTRVGDCILQDGRDLAALNATPEPTHTPEPQVTPLPEITSSVDDTAALATPTPAAPTKTPAAQPTAAPTAVPTIEPAPESTPPAPIEPTTSPAIDPTVSPTEEPTPEPTPEPTVAPTPETTTAPIEHPSPEATAESSV